MNVRSTLCRNQLLNVPEIAFAQDCMCPVLHVPEIASVSDCIVPKELHYGIFLRIALCPKLHAPNQIQIKSQVSTDVQITDTLYLLIIYIPKA